MHTRIGMKGFRWKTASLLLVCGLALVVLAEDGPTRQLGEEPAAPAKGEELRITPVRERETSQKKRLRRERPLNVSRCVCVCLSSLLLSLSGDAKPSANRVVYVCGHSRWRLVFVRRGCSNSVP